MAIFLSAHSHHRIVTWNYIIIRNGCMYPLMYIYKFAATIKIVQELSAICLKLSHIAQS